MSNYEINGTALKRVELVKDLIRPLTEYCAIVWDPYTIGEVKRIESIQKKFLKFALRNQQRSSRFQLPPYEALLSLLNLDTLEDRRRMLTLSFVHGCVEGVSNVEELSSYYFQFECHTGSWSR